MSKIYYLMFLFLITKILAQSDSASVTFNVIVHQSPDTNSIYIAGNHELLGYWKPDHTELKNIENNIWSITLRFPRGIAIEYKYTKGTWAREAIYKEGVVPGNSTLKVNTDTTVIVQVLKWRDESEIVMKGKITGNVKYHKNITGHNIKKRDVIVWLPPGYDDDYHTRYPVLYMHDGQNLMDPKTAAFKVDWQIDEVADSLIRRGMIRPLIVVGIYNTSDRMREYTNSETGRAYMKFVVETLKPLIDSTYRTYPEREHTSTGGSSAGGLISFMLLWEYSHIFSKAACLSPAFKIDEIDYVSEVLAYQGDKKDILIYMDNGGLDLDAKLQAGIDEMIQALEFLGYKSKIDYHWFQDPDAAHNEAAWSKRIWRPLKLFYEIN